MAELICSTIINVAFIVAGAIVAAKIIEVFRRRR
jgi:hypothetical protein